MATLQVKIDPTAAVAGSQQAKTAMQGVSDAAKGLDSSLSAVSARFKSLQEAQARQQQAAFQNLSVIQQQLAIQQQVIRGTISQADGVRKLAEAEIFAATGSRELSQQLAAARQQFSQNEQAISTLGQAANTTGISLQRIAETALGFTLAGAITAAVAALKNLVSEGIRYSAVLEQQQTGIASIIAATNQITNAQDQTLDGARKFNAAQQLAAGLMRQIQKDALLTTATTEQLVDAFQQALGPLSAAGLTLNQSRESTLRIVQAATALGVPIHQVSQEVRAIAEGSIDVNARLAKALGITNEQVKAAREQGQLFEFIVEKTKDFAAAGDVTAQSFFGLSSSIADVSSQLAGKVFSAPFEGLKSALSGTLDVLQDLNSALDENATKAQIAATAAERLREAQSPGFWTQVGDLALAAGKAIGGEFVTGLSLAWQGTKDLVAVLGDFLSLAGNILGLASLWTFFIAGAKALLEGKDAFQAMSQAGIDAAASIGQAARDIADRVSGASKEVNLFATGIMYAGDISKVTWSVMNEEVDLARVAIVSLTQSTDAYTTAANQAAGAAQKLAEAQQKASEGVRDSIDEHKRNIAILQEAIKNGNTYAQAQELIRQTQIQWKTGSAELSAQETVLAGTEATLVGMMKEREAATKRAAAETESAAKKVAQLAQAQQEARAALAAQDAGLKQVVAGTLTLTEAQAILARQQLAVKVGSLDVATAHLDLEKAAVLAAKAIEDETKAFERQVAKSRDLDKSILATQQGYDDSIASINAQREAFDRVIGATGSYEQAMRAAEEATVFLAEKNRQLAAGALPATAEMLAGVAVEAHRAKQGFDDYTQGLKNAADQALLSTRDIETAITGILQGTQKLGDIAEDLGQAMGVRLVKGILFGKGQDEQAILGNFNDLLGIQGAGLFQSLGINLGGGLIQSIIGGVGKAGGIGAIVGALTGSIGGGIGSALGSLAGSLGVGSSALASLGVSLGSGLSSALGIGINTALSIGGALSNLILPGIGLLAGFLGESLFGALFAHTPTKGTQIRKGVKDFLEDIEVSFASEIDSSDYFFKETKQLANKMFGGDFLAASKQILTEKAGPELARQLQALGTAVTADQAIKLGKSVEQTGTTFGNMLVDNLGVDRIPDAIAEIVQKAEINFAGLTDKLTEVFEKSKVSAEFYNDTILGAVDIFFGELPAAINVANIALQSFTDDGIFSLSEFEAGLKKATSEFDLAAQVFRESILNSADGKSAAVAFGEGFGEGLLELSRGRLLDAWLENRLFEGIDFSDGLDSSELDTLKERTRLAKEEFDALGKAVEGVEGEIAILSDTAKKWEQALEEAAAQLNIIQNLGPIGTRMDLDSDFLEGAAALAEELSGQVESGLFNGIEDALEAGGNSAALAQLGTNLQSVVFNSMLQALSAQAVLPLLQPLIAGLAAAGQAFNDEMIDATTYAATVKALLEGTDISHIKDVMVQVLGIAKDVADTIGTGSPGTTAPGDTGSKFPPGQDASGFGSGSAVSGGGGGGGGSTAQSDAQQRADERARQVADLTAQLTEIADRQREITLSLTEQLADIGALSQVTAIAVKIEQITEQLDPLISRFAAGAKLTTEELEQAESLTRDLRETIIDRYQTEVEQLQRVKDAALSAADTIRGILTDVLGTGATGPESLSQLQVQAAALRDQIAGASPEARPELMQQLAEVLQQQVQAAGQIFAPTDARFLELKNSIVNELTGLALGAEQIADNTTTAINELQAATVRELQQLGAQETALLIAQQRLLEQQLDALNTIGRGRGRGSLSSLFDNLFSAQGGLHTPLPQGGVIVTHPGEYADIWRSDQREYWKTTAAAPVFTPSASPQGTGSGGPRSITVEIVMPKQITVNVSGGQDPYVAGKEAARGYFDGIKERAGELVPAIVDSPQFGKLKTAVRQG